MDLNKVNEAAEHLDEELKANLPNLYSKFSSFQGHEMELVPYVLPFYITFFLHRAKYEQSLPLLFSLTLAGYEVIPKIVLFALVNSYE